MIVAGMAPAITTLAAVALSVEEHRVSVVIALRVADKTGLPELACEVRLDGEIVTGENERAVQGILNEVAAAAAIINEARQEGIVLTPRKKNA